MAENSRMSYIALAMMPRINSRLYFPIIERCGNIEAFFRESNAAISALEQEYNIPILQRKEAIAASIKEAEIMDKMGISVVSIEDYAYPILLRECEDSPLVLFYKGTLPDNGNHFLAIVGTRHASSRVATDVETIVTDMANLKTPPVIISGLALGIDAAAHRASLKNGIKTCAVLGQGLHTVYPSLHRDLAERIIGEGGALISEYSTQSSVSQGNFLKRNRIIAGMSHLTFVAESAVKGGAMSTARIAASYNRDVAAFPGRIEDKFSSGCNLLIKQNIAALIENASDIARLLGIDQKITDTKQQQLTFSFDANYNDREQEIINILCQHEHLHIDELSRTINIPVNDLSVTLLKMEFDNKIIEYPGKNYAVKN